MDNETKDAVMIALLSDKKVRERLFNKIDISINQCRIESKCDRDINLIISFPFEWLADIMR